MALEGGVDFTQRSLSFWGSFECEWDMWISNRTLTHMSEWRDYVTTFEWSVPGVEKEKTAVYISMILSHCCVARAVWIHHWNIESSNFSASRIAASLDASLSVWKDLQCYCANCLYHRAYKTYLAHLWPTQPWSAYLLPPPFVKHMARLEHFSTPRSIPGKRPQHPSHSRLTCLVLQTDSIGFTFTCTCSTTASGRYSFL